MLAARGALAYEITPPIRVPDTEPGIRYNPSSVLPPVKLEVFIEIHCPDSLAAWPILKSVQEHYGSTKLDLVVQQLPMPYHRNAFLATQGVYLIEKELPNEVFHYMEANMQNWLNFTTASTVDKTDTEVLDMLADLAVASTGISKNLFVSTIPHYSVETVVVWKYGVRRAVAATPTFFTNGVELGCGTNIPTKDDWIKFLDPIINKT